MDLSVASIHREKAGKLREAEDGNEIPEFSLQPARISSGEMRGFNGGIRKMQKAKVPFAFLDLDLKKLLISPHRTAQRRKKFIIFA